MGRVGGMFGDQDISIIRKRAVHFVAPRVLHEHLEPELHVIDAKLQLARAHRSCGVRRQ